MFSPLDDIGVDMVTWWLPVIYTMAHMRLQDIPTMYYSPKKQPLQQSPPGSEKGPEQSPVGDPAEFEGCEMISRWLFQIAGPNRNASQNFM